MILCRVDIFEYCELDVPLKKVRMYPKDWKPEGECVFEGLYYPFEDGIFAIFVTKNGPMMYYNESEYVLTPDLSISVKKMGDNRHFSIKEYGIEIDYPTSKYIDMDVWSTEEDVDLFVNIANNYQSKEFYEKYTSKE